MTFFDTSNLGIPGPTLRNGSISPWTVERELTVRRLWKAGHSAGEINLELGGTTRNAVIGKLFRMGLTKGDRAEGVEIKCLPGARTAGAKVQRRPDGFRRKPDKRPAKPLQQLFASPLPEPAPDIPPHERIPLLALTEDSCRYPIGDPRTAGFGFCNGKRVNGISYCGFHARICYQPPAVRQDKRPRR